MAEFAGIDHRVVWNTLGMHGCMPTGGVTASTTMGTVSSGSARFFKLEKFPNAMKHKIVGNYLKGALPTLINYSKRDVWYADLFAGAGRYDDGQPGSPVIVAEEAKKRIDEGKTPLIRCFNVEKDPKTFDLLQKNTAHIPSAAINNRRGDWSEHLPELLAVTQSAHAPLIVFLDPFGFAGIELTKLVQILSGIGSEAREMIITFNVGGVQRMVAAARSDEEKRESYYRLPDRVFGTSEWRSHIVDGELPDVALPGLVALYEQRLLRTGGEGFQRAVMSVGIPKRIGGQEAYFLLFVTRSAAGVWQMNESANRALERAWLEEEEKYLVPELVTGVPRYAERMAALEAAIPGEVRAFLRTQPFGTKVEHIYMDLADRHFAKFRMMHLGGALRALRKEGIIITNPPNRLERDTFVNFATKEQRAAG
jgi:three-Cys-motif partner protein